MAQSAEELDMELDPLDYTSTEDGAWYQTGGYGIGPWSVYMAISWDTIADSAWWIYAEGTTCKLPYHWELA